MVIDPIIYCILIGVLCYFVSRSVFGFPFAGGVMAGTLVFAVLSLICEELRR